MNRFLSIAVLVFVATRCSAQSLPEFAPIGAAWHYTRYEISGAIHTDVYQSTAEATVDGKLCKEISGADLFHVYRDSLKIYIYDTNYWSNEPAQWRLLYDFGKNVGDTFYAATPFFDTDTIPVLVVAKGDTVINGHTLPFMIIASSTVGLSNFHFDGKAVMNIGLESFFFYPWPVWMDPSKGGLRCYEDGTLGLYQLSSPCVYNWIGIDKANEEANFDVFPIPALEQITVDISFPNNQTVKLQLLDVAGRELLSQLSTEKRIVVPVKNLANGIYWIKISSSNRSSSRLFTVNRR